MAKSEISWGNKRSKCERKPDTKSRKMENVIRYVSSQDPKKKASLRTGKPY